MAAATARAGSVDNISDKGSASNDDDDDDDA